MTGAAPEPAADDGGQPATEPAASAAGQAPAAPAVVPPVAADRPELAIGAAFAGGLALALLLKRLAR
jgi:hypothetical protein